VGKAAAIFGCAGLSLSDEERRFFADSDPLGFILFARNLETPDQVRRLVGDLRDSIGRANAFVLIDQEGGRVARLRPPYWRAAPASSCIGELFATDRQAGLEAARLNGRLLADELLSLGINVDCAPVLDLRFRDAHEIIGDRSFGACAAEVAAMGRALAVGLLAGGVLPVIKHIPGHGRATQDSHEALPVVDTVREVLENTDFAPFRDLADMPAAMTAHVVYSAVDSAAPATTSPLVIEEIIRGFIGFDGLLISDDLSMSALAGDLGVRARSARDAGCDVVLHCNGVFEEMVAVAGACGALSSVALDRVSRAAAVLKPPVPEENTAEQLDALLGREHRSAG
jgi:beta-N-acetylhexosaminidase